VTTKTARRLITFENKVLRKIYGPVIENNQWRIRHNIELREMSDEADITAVVKSQRLRWFGQYNQGRDEWTT